MGRRTYSLIGKKKCISIAICYNLDDERLKLQILHCEYLLKVTNNAITLPLHVYLKHMPRKDASISATYQTLFL